MSGLFKAQDSVFTLGDEEIEDLDPADFTLVEKGRNKAPAATSHSAIDKGQEDISQPVSSAAGATQGPLNGIKTTLQVLSDATGHNAIKEAEPGEDTMEPSTTINSATDQQKQIEARHPDSATAEEAGPVPAPQSAATEDTGSKSQNGSAQIAQGTVSEEHASEDEGQHLDEDEEQRIAEVRPQSPALSLHYIVLHRHDSCTGPIFAYKRIFAFISIHSQLYRRTMQSRRSRVI